MFILHHKENIIQQRFTPRYSLYYLKNIVEVQTFQFSISQTKVYFSETSNEKPAFMLMRQKSLEWLILALELIYRCFHTQSKYGTIIWTLSPISATPLTFATVVNVRNKRPTTRKDFWYHSMWNHIRILLFSVDDLKKRGDYLVKSRKTGTSENLQLILKVN